MHPHVWHTHLDTAAIGAALLLANLHLLGFGLPPTTLALQPAQFPHAGWGIVTHPFVHVSAYHLLLDALAFFTLYPTCSDRARVRLGLLACCALGSLGGAWLDPAMAANGFCGLSGIDHGLMAAAAADLLIHAPTRGGRRLGAALLGLVAGKSLLEIALGAPAFAGLHLGNIGAPNVWSHLGGTIAGAVAARQIHMGGVRRSATKHGHHPAAASTVHASISPAR